MATTSTVLESDRVQEIRLAVLIIIEELLFVLILALLDIQIRGKPGEKLSFKAHLEVGVKLKPPPFEIFGPPFLRPQVLLFRKDRIGNDCLDSFVLIFEGNLTVRVVDELNVNIERPEVTLNSLG